MWRRLHSTLDASVNFILKKTRGQFEARYVYRGGDYISAYVSSHTGCNQGCQFCWLTAMKETSMSPVSIDDYNEQLRMVLDHANQRYLHHSVQRVNINFMARGDGFMNKSVRYQSTPLFDSLEKTVQSFGFRHAKMNVSTIMPKDAHSFDLSTQLDPRAFVYWSAYSVNPVFRNKWMPNAMNVDAALCKLKEYQRVSQTPLTIHYCVIRGENDSLEDASALRDKIRRLSVFGKFNLVRFNPPDSMKEVQEADDQRQQQILDIISSAFVPHPTSLKKSRIVARVGQDVAASCGMFI